MRSPTNIQSILVIDDDPIMRDVLSLTLGAEGHEVCVAHSGEQALAMLADGHASFSVVLTDMHMPGLHGVALAERLAEAIARTAVLVGMSGSEPKSEEVQAFHAFLQKPFTTGEFAAAVAQARSLAAVEMHAVKNPCPEALPATAAPLDETIFARLAAMMPAAQLEELYQLTLGDVQRRVLRMREAARSGDDALFRAEAHSIKGGCGMVGAKELSALAASVEQDTRPTARLFEEFDAACSRLRSMLDARTG
jgi:CheY-like chemotaxis protein/HPt (histidine-containing phosphotransfer) domain-containing protein